MTLDIPLRTAYKAALASATGLSVWVKKVPKTASTIPDQYILITTQSKTRTAIAKADQTITDNYDWLASIEFQIVNNSISGMANPGANDVIEPLVINVADTIQVPGWSVKSRDLLQQTDLDIDTPQ